MKPLKLTDINPLSESLTNITIIGISQLPVELVRVILVDVASRSGADRKGLMEVCFQWREILCGTPSLWTRILIHATYRRAIDDLSIKLSRCGTLMLDVICNLNGWSESATASLFTFLSHQAPFSRWRTLELWNPVHPTWTTFALHVETRFERDNDAGCTLTEYMLRDMGSFRNLERLTVHEKTPMLILKRVSESGTSKLTELTLKMSHIDRETMSGIGGILKHIRRLDTSTSAVTSLELPPNLMELRTPYAMDVMYPYIKSLSFTSYASLSSLQYFPNLASLTLSFRARSTFRGFPVPLSYIRTSPVTLPNLISLDVHGSEFRDLVFISIPNLQRLVVRVSPQSDYSAKFLYEERLDTLTEALSQDSFSLSPSVELDFGFSPLPAETLGLALTKMSQAKRITINASKIDRDWLDLVILLTKTNTACVLRGSAILAETLILKPDSSIKRLNSISRRVMAEEILEHLQSTGIRMLEIVPEDEPKIVVRREDICIRKIYSNLS